MKLRSSLYGLAALVVSLAAGGCYNPDFENGRLQCGPNDECPSGYTCNKSASSATCFKDGAGGAGGAGGGGAGGSGGTAGMQDGGAPMCFAQFFENLRCMPKVEVGTCDPVCQSGCGCRERCTIAGNTTVCRAYGPMVGRGLYDTCDPNNDLCQPGSICLGETREQCGAHCYRFCRDDGDCGTRARCTGEIEIANSSIRQKTCSPQIQECEPWPGGRSNCRANFGCYILSGLQPDLAICECAGTKKEGDTCEFEHECQPGFECLPSGGVRACRRLCQLGQSCPGSGTCSEIALQGGVRSKKVGFCR